MIPENARKAAEILGTARVAKRRLTPLPPDCAPADLPAAYDIQDALHDWFAAEGVGAQIGHKIGCTTPVMQRYMSVDGPSYGGMLAATTFDGPKRFERNAFQAPGVETEITVRIGRDVPASATPYTRETIAGFVDSCMPSMEIVDNRYGDFMALGIPLLVADDFFHGACVHGAPKSLAVLGDLSVLRAAAFADGASFGTGTGADVLGHPLEAVAWLANTLAGRGRGLAAGQLVMTGSMVVTKWIDAPPNEIRIEIEGLGGVSAVFE